MALWLTLFVAGAAAVCALSEPPKTVNATIKYPNPTRIFMTSFKWKLMPPMRTQEGRVWSRDPSIDRSGYGVVSVAFVEFRYDGASQILQSRCVPGD